jgi:tRNA pseudouridine55 synthase
MDLNRKYDFPEGEMLLIDKPSDWTSFDVVNKIRHMMRRHLGIKKIKVGHAGTLDPLATGLLLVCVGKATKKINEFTGLDKEYTGTLFIGATTPSYDKETKVDQEFDTAHISEEMIRQASKQFIGKIKQIPPIYSAIKVDGTRAYKMARGNEKVVMPEREVHIHEFEITEAGIPESSFRVSCSKGTYIRSLAHDFGKSLECGAYIQSLRRTRIGDHKVEDSISIPQLAEFLTGQADKQA